MTRSDLPESFWRFGVLFALVLVWELIARWLSDDVLPPPTVVAVTMWETTLHGELLHHLGKTLLRVLIAFIVAFGVGCCLGILMGRSGKIDASLDGLLVVGLNIPALVTIILCYVWFGLNEAAAILAVAINKIPTTVVTVREGARTVNQELMQVARVFRLSRVDTLHNVYLPQLYPYFMAAARNGLALIWKIVLVVELLGRSDGVGFQLGVHFQFFNIKGVLAYTVAFVTIILLIEGCIMRPLDQYIAKWRDLP